MLRLYSSPYCPYAQRPRALLTRLDIEHELREIDLADRDPAFLKLCPTGRVPLLDDGGRLLFESAVICEYLAAKVEWRQAWDGDPYLEHRQRLALAQWDGSVAPAFYRTMREPDSTDFAALDRELDFFEETLRLTGGGADNLLAICCAPHWVRMQWMAERSEMAAELSKRPPLRAWLDAAAAAPWIQSTLPDREDMVRLMTAKFAAVAG